MKAPPFLLSMASWMLVMPGVLHAIGIRDLRFNNLVWPGFNPSGYSNESQTDPFGSEDNSTVSLRWEEISPRVGITYDITAEGTLSRMRNLGPGHDVTLGSKLSFRFEIFPPSYQKLSSVLFSGANLTRFVLDESGATWGYPSLEFDIEPVAPMPSPSHPDPMTAIFGVRINFDDVSDGEQTKGQTVILVDVPLLDVGEPMHVTSGSGSGIGLEYSGLMSQPRTIRSIFRQQYVDSWGPSTGFGDVHGSVNGMTPPVGFSFQRLGSPTSNGLATYDLGVAGETFEVFDMTYDGWGGKDDIQFGWQFAPLDQDYDGLPDAWEDLHGFNKTVADDATHSDGDRDRQSAYDEYLQGTDPNDPNSRFYVTNSEVMAGSGGYLMTWTSKPDRNYYLQYLDPGGQGWLMVPGASPIPGGPGDTTSHTIPDARSTFGNQSLFRVGVTGPQAR